VAAGAQALSTHPINIIKASGLRDMLLSPVEKAHNEKPLVTQTRGKR
jgi:hypothetical protein